MITFPADADITPSKRVKFGIDPTFPRLHLGHFVPLRLIKKMRDEGHKVTIVLGTFTAQLGDPSGRDSTRPILREDEILFNSEKILNTVKGLLGPDIDFFFNHSLHNSTTIPEFLRNVASKFTLSYMTSRNAFADRIKNNHPIAIHELLVPMLQGMDSVHLQTEIEIGGQDQLFNFQIARQLQDSFGQKPQSCVMLPIINGVDGRKMSKSLGNCIFLDEPARDIFGKVMSISDSVMEEWFPLLSDTTRTSSHPMENKKILAFDIIKQLRDINEAEDSQLFFEKTVQQKAVPDKVQEIQVETLIEAIQKIRNCSKTACRTLLACKAVRINGDICTEDRLVSSGEIIQVGKRDFVKVL